MQEAARLKRVMEWYRTPGEKGAKAVEAAAKALSRLMKKPFATPKIQDMHTRLSCHIFDSGKLFNRQKETLDLFLARKAISRTQYDKSLGDIIAKMGLRQEG